LTLFSGEVRVAKGREGQQVANRGCFSSFAKGRKRTREAPPNLEAKKTGGRAAKLSIT